MSKAEIWAIGGGKGGTGKSFITSNIGCALAMKGKRVALVDADLGGANLHSFLGIKRPQKTISDFFEKKAPLEDLFMKTSLDTLSLLTGDVQALDSDDVKFAQKQKLFRHIRNLDADYILMDLGAGSHTTTLDSFLMADRMVVVMVPAVTSIENLYHFIKNVYFRKLKNVFGQRGMKDIVMDTWKNRASKDIHTLGELVEFLSQSSPEAEHIIQEDFRKISLHVVLNQVRTMDDVELGTAVRSVLRKYLGVNAEFVGFVRMDETILRCLNEGEAFMTKYPSSRGAKEVNKVLENILEGKQMPEVVG